MFWTDRVLPVGVGVAGELYLGGEGLARGLPASCGVDGGEVSFRTLSVVCRVLVFTVRGIWCVTLGTAIWSTWVVWTIR